ncbi:FtsX-like permease family protein [Nocardia sp. CNY236]|uniref:FtsX-like permease family protein n=1 Tax=Nocardia sp. CNY236 TaxID=1169152 RepID=UPI00350F251B
MRPIRTGVLTRKVRRDLRRRPAQAAAIAVTVMLGVLLFVASYDSFRNLSTSYERTYTRLHFADFTATGGDPIAAAAAVRETSGVARVSVRTRADVPMTIGTAKLLGRISGLAADPNSGVNDIDLTAGRLPDSGQTNEVVIEQHTADTFGLGVGDRFQVFDGSAWQRVIVSGVGHSPEYLWPARNRQELFADPHSFAIAFAAPLQAQSLSGRTGPTETLVEMSATATAADHDRVAALLRSSGANDVLTRAEQPSDAALSEDLRAFSEIAVGFPLLFLLAAGIAEYVLLTRLVRAERPVIGTLLAMGARRGALIRHYVTYSMIVAVIGGVAGAALGTAATAVVTRAYTGVIGIPDTVVEHRISTLTIGLGLGLAAGVFAAVAPALAAARTAPAQAMRGNGVHLLHPGPLARISARWTGLPAVARMTLRSLTRDRRRTLATMTGTVLALVLILASVGMVTSMRTLVAVQFEQVNRQDATVVVAPEGSEHTGALYQVPGVAEVETGLAAPVTVQANGRSYTTTLTGLQPNTTMHGFRTVSGAAGLPTDGLVAGSALSERLDVHVGDTLTVVAASGGSAREVRLAALVDEPLGTVLYATDTTARIIAPTALPTYLLRFAPGADRDDIRAAVTRLPGTVAYTDTLALRATFDRFLGLFWVFIAVMLGFGAILAFTVIYVTMTVNLAERTTELATLRAAGVANRRLTAALAAENLTATALATPLGLGAGIAVAWAFLRSFSSDMFTMHLSLGASAPALAVAAVLVAAGLSQLPALRFLQRIDIARVVRERAQ